jgi:hypothetical protein
MFHVGLATGKEQVSSAFKLQIFYNYDRVYLRVSRDEFLLDFCAQLLVAPLYYVYWHQGHAETHLCSGSFLRRFST